jgi:hypothetical protein
MFKEMIEEDWVMEFLPIENHINTDAEFEGHMFAVDGQELDFIKSQNHYCIWTLVESDSEGAYIYNGWKPENKVGYFLTEVPWSKGDEIKVSVIDDEEDTFLDELAGEIDN